MKKILVIEDDPDIREIILETLDAEDFEAIGAENGKIGVALATREPPDLILCDVMMPKLDGYGVITQLRRNLITESIPFIFLSAKAAKADWRYGMKLGADDYLTKPFTRQELLDAIAMRFSKQMAMRRSYNQELEAVKEKLNEFLYSDQLTKLPNQLALRERFEQMVKKLENNQCVLPILLLDLDRSHQLHDRLGKISSDLVIQAIAKRLKGYIESEDIIARLNTGDFLIIPTLVEPRGVTGFAQTILNACAQPFIIDQQSILITASLGITFCTPSKISLTTLLHQSRQALYSAQKRGSNQYQIYTSELDVRSTEKRILENNLYQAVENLDFQIYYQPQVSLKTGKIIGAEALLRWIHPELGFISPADFIPIAEEKGWIIRIGEWILRTTCTDLKSFQQLGYPSLRIAVNLSAQQFSQNNLSHKITEILKAVDLDPKSLELEITESTLVQDVKSAVQTLNQLRNLGIQISIDDFGTGYSSLGYLKQFPFNNLKIDRCFVQNIDLDLKNNAITSAMIQMAHGLNLNVIAEGIETKEELTFFCQKKCHSMQGYLFSRPLPKSEFEALLHSGKTLSF